jgi:signal transduction histidine kinase
VHRRVRAATSADRPFGLEYRIVRADGTAAWVLERGQQVVAADGTACLHGVIFDVTERRELKAKRARIIAAQDETRRQIGRDLHDGAQQRLVSVSLALRALRSRLPDHPRGGGRDGRRGEHGLPTAVPALAARATLPVDVTCSLAHRLPPAVEIAAYYVVSESLTNMARHARATRGSVELSCAEDALLVRIADDGVGGADPGRVGP